MMAGKKLHTTTNSSGVTYTPLLQLRVMLYEVWTDLIILEDMTVQQIVKLRSRSRSGEGQVKVR